MDELDKGILQALQIDGRASFRRIADLMEVSEQTVARRYRRLYADGVVRVVCLPDPLAVGRSQWFVRITCRPDAAGALADALAKREDVAWVSMTSGGSEITCSLRPQDDIGSDDVLLQRLPRTAPVLSFTAYAILHRFAGGQADWVAYTSPFTAAQLAGFAPTPPPPATPPAHLGPDDQDLVRLLSRDGRATYVELAAATGWSQAQVARRLEELLASGLMYVDTELSSDLLGFATHAYLWLTVRPDAVDRVGNALVELPQVAFVAAATGPANLLVAAMCRDPAELYLLTTRDIGAIGDVERLEVAPVIRKVKQAGSLMDGPRLTSRR